MDTLVAGLRRTFESGVTSKVAWRQEQLRGVIRMLEENEAVFVEALRADLGKPRMEAINSEIGPALNEAKSIASHFPSALAPERVSIPLVAGKGMSTGYIEARPRGVVAVISPWNFPLVLCISPLVAALAGGNAVVIKPSEISAHTAAALAAQLPRYCDTAAVAVVTGGVPETTALLKERFDLIAFTGGPEIGKVVMRAAAAHLTPCILELGGKSPVYVDASCDLRVTARRIAWAKALNAGQICIAPDYALVHASVYDAFCAAIGAAWREFFGADAAASPDYARIVSDRHFARVSGMLAADTAGDAPAARVAHGGRVDAATRYIEPTLLTHVDPERAACMRDEIFGPLLPTIPVASAEAAVAFINARPNRAPLALYVFAANRAVVSRVLDGVDSGTAVVNDCVMQFGTTSLPFGGCGNSGYGYVHGKAGLEGFVHRRSVLDAAGRMADLPVRYPPYSDFKAKCVRFLLKH